MSIVRCLPVRTVQNETSMILLVQLRRQLQAWTFIDFISNRKASHHAYVFEQCVKVGLERFRHRIVRLRLQERFCNRPSTAFDVACHVEEKIYSTSAKKAGTLGFFYRF